ncbi:hypothetical protein PFISCL1PPCAC_19752, partial [Pristionchus fissidentatus]
SSRLTVSSIMRGCGSDPSRGHLILHVQNCDWYWGELDWKDAKRMLWLCAPGTYLLRDSRSESSVFSFSYRTADKVLHSRADDLLLRAAKDAQDKSISPLRAFEELVKRCNGKDLEMLLYQKNNNFANINFSLTCPLRKRDCVPSLQFLTRKLIRENFHLFETVECLPRTIVQYISESKQLNPPIDECIRVLQFRASYMGVDPPPNVTKAMYI